MIPDICHIEGTLRRIDKLNGDCARNMQALNQMMLELKGLIGMVRAKANDTRPGMDWYKHEISNPNIQIQGPAFEIEDLSIKD